MKKKEQILKRQMSLFKFLEEWSGGKVTLSTNSILAKNDGIYRSKIILERDLKVLESKFLIKRSRWFIAPTKRVRKITIVNRNKDLRGETNSDYLEATALANPNCMLVEWRVGYDYFEGDVEDYLEEIKSKNGVTCTGVYLKKDITVLFKSIDKSRYIQDFTVENPWVEDNRPCALGSDVIPHKPIKLCGGDSYIDQWHEDTLEYIANTEDSLLQEKHSDGFIRPATL